MLQRVLAAVDDSPRAPGVVEMAVDIATRFDGQVHLLRVVAPPLQFPAAARNPPEHVTQELLTKAADDLKALTQGRGRIHLEAPILDSHEPWRVILEAGRRLSVDIIVVGSHGLAGWDHLLGTVPGKLAEHADRHILVVHQPALERH